MKLPSMTQRELARRVPELPRWVELRSMLLGGRARVFGGPDDFAALDGESGLAVVYGSPGLAVVQAALGEAREALAPAEARLEIPGWKPERAILYRLEVSGFDPRLPAGAQGSRGNRTTEPPAVAGGQSLPEAAPIRLLSREELAGAALPDELREELLRVSRYAPVAAAFVNGAPASFCYALESETLFDLSIDTLETARGRGLATATAAWMIRYQRERGRAPVWGALASNAASQRTAARLGFVPCDELLVYARALD